MSKLLEVRNDMNQRRKNVEEKVSHATSKKFAFLTGGSQTRNYEAIIGIANKNFKVSIDSNGDLAINKLPKLSKSRNETNRK